MSSECLKSPKQYKTHPYHVLLEWWGGCVVVLYAGATTAQPKLDAGGPVGASTAMALLIASGPANL